MSYENEAHELVTRWETKYNLDATILAAMAHDISAVLEAERDGIADLLYRELSMAARYSMGLGSGGYEFRAVADKIKERGTNGERLSNLRG